MRGYARTQRLRTAGIDLIDIFICCKKLVENVTYDDAVKSGQPLVDFLQDVFSIEDRVNDQFGRIGFDDLCTKYEKGSGHGISKKITLSIILMAYHFV
jgi:hypothetical protein